MAIPAFRTRAPETPSASALFEAIVRSSGDAIISKSLDGIVTSWNPQAHTVFGYSAAEMVGAPMVRLFPPERVEEERTLLDRIRRGEAVPAFATTRLHKSGAIVDVSVSLSPILDDDGQVMGVATIARDLAPWKQAEREFFRSEARLQAIIDVAPVPLALNDDVGTITYLNPAFTRTFGYRKEDLPTLEHWWPAAYPDPTYREWVSLSWSSRLDHARRTGKPFEPLEVRIRCRDGAEKIAMASAASLGDSFAGTHLVTLHDITDLVTARTSLAKVQRYAEVIVTSMGEGLCHVDPEGRVAFINPVGARLLGYEPSELTGQVLHTKLHDPPKGRCDAATCGLRQALMGSETPHGATDHFSRKDGQGFDVQYVCAPMRTDTALLGSVLTFRDVSEEVRTRKFLIENEVKVRKAQEIAGFGSYATDLTTGRWESSAQLDNIFGIDAHFPHDIPHWNSLLAPEFREAALEHYQEVARGACEFRMDYQILRPRDGARRWVAANGELELGADGRPRRLIGTIQDITDRKEIEAALQTSHDLLNKLSEQVPGVLFQFKLDSAGRFSLPFASRGLKSMFGHTLDSLGENGASLFESIPQEDRAAFTESIRTSARTLEDWTSEFRVELPEVGIRWRQGQARPERQPDGSTLWHGVISDATERVETQRELASLNERLESRVADRTRALEAALRNAELAKRARGDFLAKMSHEIRTPLNAILGLTHLGLGDELPAKTRRQLEHIQGSGQHLLGLLNDVLDVAKIDAGKLVLTWSELDLNQLLRDVVQMTEPRAKEKGLTLTLALAANVPHRVRGDALRLRQVLINLVGNAVKFTDQGGVVVRARSTADGLLHFEVEDTGLGLTEEQQTRLFQSFEQGDNSTTRRFGGTGLGLAICKQLVSLMGGQVGVRSKPGRGSTFWFTAALPLTEGTPVTLPDLASLEALRGRRILVVDDHSLNLEVAQGLLEEVGVHVTAVTNATDGLAALEHTTFDCVLMDVQMPGMDGLEATRRLRLDPRWAGLRVLAMTANALAEDRQRYLAGGMDDVVTKPLDPPVLYRTIVHWLEPSRAKPLASGEVDEAAQWRTLPLCDAEALHRVVGKSVSAHQRILAAFLGSAKKQVLELKQASEHGHLAALADLAHILKSSARTVGGRRLGGCCAALERAGREEVADQCTSLTRELVELLSDTEAALTAIHGAQP